MRPTFHNAGVHPAPQRVGENAARAARSVVLQIKIDLKVRVYLTEEEATGM
jgi:hypothetical protein